MASASVRWNFLRGKRERQFFFPLEFQKYCLNKLHPQHSEENTKCSPRLPQLAPLISFPLLFPAKAAHSGASGIWDSRHLYFLGPISLIFICSTAATSFFSFIIGTIVESESNELYMLPSEVDDFVFLERTSFS